MTLEDFFTLTEMKDGLTSLARVEELVSVMKKEKDASVKNLSDATRQWAAVASAIAATKNKECLDLFIQLDGLWFIDRWLRDAQSFATEASDCSVEEAISALLQAIERLQIENERLISSGICITVKSLLSYRSSKVQEKARALFDDWKAKNVDVISMDVEKAVYSDPELNNEHPESTADDLSPKTAVGDQKLGSGEKTNDQDGSQITSNHADVKNGCSEAVASAVKLESGEGSVSVRMEGCHSDGKLDQQYLSDTKQGINEPISEVLKAEHMVEDGQYGNKIENVPDRPGKIPVSSGSDIKDNPSRHSMVAEEGITKTDVDADDVKDALINKCTSGNNIDGLVAESGDGMDKGAVLEHKGLDQGDGCSALEETKDRGTTVSRLEDVDGCKEAKRHSKSKSISKRKSKSKSKNKNKYFGSSYEFTRLTKNSKDTDAIRQTPDMDLENGIVDALDFARLVAKEVEREVVGYYEQSGSSSSSSSSSESISRGSSQQLDSPESTNEGQDPQTDGPSKEFPAIESMSPEISEKEPLGNSANQDAKLENHVQDMESSQVTDAVREQESITEKSACGFDLNQEFSSEDPDNQVDTISNPASVVSASRAVAAPRMPAAPHHFEGNLGWKGSAAISAFHPASPRQASSSDRALSGGGTSSGSRQRQEFLDIDLNVAEGGDDRTVYPVAGKQKSLLPGLPSGESSVELSPKRTDRLKFDLNLIGDDGDVLASEWKMGGPVFGAPKCQRSPSPASSSCIVPSMRNFDLNYNPSNCNDQSRQQPYLGESSSQKVSPYVGPSDDSVISILGTKVKKNTFPPQTPLAYPNGRASEPVVDASFLRGGSLVGLGPAVPYPQSVYSYNGFAIGPAGPFSSGPMYGATGPIPYMLDPRGAPFMPQMVGSTSAVPSSYCQPSLVMNLVGPTPVSNTAGPFRPNLDLNSGGYAFEAGNRDPSFYRPLFVPGQVRPSLEDQLRDNFFRPLNSSGASSGKRKEPESGWELFPTNYKHHQPPHL